MFDIRKITVPRQALLCLFVEKRGREGRPEAVTSSPSGPSIGRIHGSGPQLPDGLLVAPLCGSMEGEEVVSLLFGGSLWMEAHQSIASWCLAREAEGMV